MSSDCDGSFYLTVDYASGANGCYEDTTTSVNDLDAYFLDGLEAEGSSVVYATSTFRDDHVRELSVVLTARFGVYFWWVHQLARRPFYDIFKSKRRTFTPRARGRTIPTSGF